MPTKTLELKTPLRNMVLNLSGRVNSATKEEELNISLGRNTKPYHYQRLAFAWAEIANCYLCVRGGDCSLWIGRVNVNVRQEDVDLIATTFGIRIDKEVEGSAA